MNRIITLSFLIGLLSLSYGQNIKVNENKNDVYVDSILNVAEDAITLHNNAMIFFTETFKNGAKVVQLDQPNLIIGKGKSEIYIPFGMSAVSSILNYTIRIDIKDQKYKYTISDLYFSSNGTETSLGLYWLTTKTMTKSALKWKESSAREISLLESLIIASMVAKPNDW